MLRFTQPREIEPYLSDASQFRGSAEGVVFPKNEKEVSDFLKEANAGKIPVTVSGGKTGLTGAAVPQGGWVLSTEKLSRILEIKKDPRGVDSWARAEPGIFLKDLNQLLEKESLFYAPDPTGPKAFLGGTLATNASGPNSFKYGATRHFIRRIRILLPDGQVLDLRRGQIFSNREGILDIPLVDRKLKAPVPHYQMPPIKHAGGYFSAPGMDAVDLFIGSEGTLGVVTQIEVKLLPKPAQVLAFLVFFRSEEDSWCFAKAVREMSIKNRKGNKEGDLEARILEYFDSGSLELLRPNFPSIPSEGRACLFIEQEIAGADLVFAQDDGETQGLPLQEKWHRLFEKEKSIVAIWEGGTPERREEFRNFRSALPLAVKDFLAQHHQVKIGTDTCVPDERFEELMLFHRRRVEESGLTNVTFGHIGESHVHLNLLPKSDQEQEKGRRLYPELVEKAVVLGGTFSAEHGVGKLKRDYLTRFYGEKGIQEMARVKRIFDPNLILGRGNLFEIE